MALRFRHTGLQSLTLKIDNHFASEYKRIPNITEVLFEDGKDIIKSCQNGLVKIELAKLKEFQDGSFSLHVGSI